MMDIFQYLGKKYFEMHPDEAEKIIVKQPEEEPQEQPEEAPAEETVDSEADAPEIEPVDQVDQTGWE